MEAAIESASAWGKFKQRLAAKVPWLGPIVPDFYGLVLKSIKDHPIDAIDYDPLLVEPLAKDIVAILDRCLTYRRDAQELEILAVKAAVDYAKFSELSTVQLEYEIAALGLERLTKEEETAKKTATEFGAGGSPLEKGFSAEATGRIASIGIALQVALRQRELTEQKWSITTQYEKEAQVRHTQSDNSHNYAQRMEKIVRLLAEDLQEAHVKLTAVSTGLQAVLRCPRF